MRKKHVVLGFIFLTASLIVLTIALFIVQLFSTKEQEAVTFEIISVEIVYNGMAVTEIDKQFIDESFQFAILVNGGEDYDEHGESLVVEWEILGETLNCQIDEIGNFTIGDTLGNIIVQVKVKSKNEMATRVKVNIIAGETNYLENIEAILPESGYTLVEGQLFDPLDLKVELHFLNISKIVYVTTFTFSKTPVAAVESSIIISYTHAGIIRNTAIPIVVIPKSLQSIEILQEPLKTNYKEGESFDITGLKVVANYEYIFGVEIETFVILNAGEPLTPENTHITILYTEDSITKTVKQPITVNGRVLQNISLNISEVRRTYTQGEVFDTEGLVVTAHYEMFDRVIFDFELNKKSWLKKSDTAVTISYTENNITCEQSFSITVLAPYSKVREVKFENPFDAALSWIYFYYTDDGTQKIDFTELKVEEYDSTELSYDAVLGIYHIPVGARITLSVINPTVNDFILGGAKYGLIYPETTANFILEDGEYALDITFSKLAGEKIVVRFENGRYGENRIFIYPINWEAPLRAFDLAQIGQIYEDSNDRYFVFSIDERDYLFSELAEVVIEKNTLVSVIECDRSEDNRTVKLNIEYYNGIILSVVVDKSGLGGLPQIERMGYSLIGFAETLSGEVFDGEAFAEWLENAEDGAILYAVYLFNGAMQTGNLVGVWQYEEAAADDKIELIFTFNTDGTYRYVVKVNDVENCVFIGIYKQNDEVISILNVETEMEYLLVSANDFNIKFENGELEASLIVIDGLTIGRMSVHLSKMLVPY